MLSSPSIRALALLLAVGATGHAQDDPKLVAKAHAIHAKAIKIDTHVDINPAQMIGPPPNYVTGIERNKVDLPKMEKDGLDAIFFSIYVGQRQDFSDSAYARATAGDIEKFEAVHTLAEKMAPDRIQIAYSAADVRRIHAAGKKVALMGVENGYGIGTDITNVKKFFDRGARYLALSHDGHNQLTDSNTGDTDNIWKWNGLSPLGKQAVEEANRYGIMMDISHPSKQANLQVMTMSKAPVIASHSGVRALCDHRRNLDDEQLLALKKNGGVVQLVALSAFVKTPIPDSPERAAAVAELRRQSGLGGGQGGARRAGQPNDSAFAAYRAKQAELDAKFPPSPRATVKDFVNHIDYAVKLIGVQHVGIASDFDGGGGVEGYDNASESFNVTMELVRRGYSEQDIIAMWGGNLLRVMAQTEQVARKIQGGK